MRYAHLSEDPVRAAADDIAIQITNAMGFALEEVEEEG